MAIDINCTHCGTLVFRLEKGSKRMVKAVAYCANCNVRIISIMSKVNTKANDPFSDFSDIFSTLFNKK